jgi:putative endopeptidase
MSISNIFLNGWLVVASTALIITSECRADESPKVPRFSLDYLDRSVNPATNFYQFACGTWIKENPVPADKSRWGSFIEVGERNWFLLHEILESSITNPAPANSPAQKVRDFYKSATDTNRLEGLAFKPLEGSLKQIDGLRLKEDLAKLLADFHQRGVEACFSDSVSPDSKNSEIYAFHLHQGGLGLPDRDYYLKDSFAKQREAYVTHITKMLTMLGEPSAEAKAHATTILDLETSLAKASKSRVDLRDPLANYHKVAVKDLEKDYPDLYFKDFIAGSGLKNIKDLIVGQPEYLAALDAQVKDRPLDEWKTYLRWHLVRSAAPFLHTAAEEESFAFYGTTLRGQPAQEPRWQRAGKVIDSEIGEALGQLFVEKNFPPAARARMNELVGNLKVVFRDHLKKLDWMTESTREKALAKFDLFTQKIGYPEKFRDYSTVDVRPDDFFGNVQRATLFESKRELVRVGKPIDKAEWHMTPPTVNAYFNPLQNEIVFPAGILQPPFFDAEMDDAVNYGAIGVVIGHEITHGYDDQGRKYDAHGNLNDWWTEADGKAFDARAQKVVDQYNAYEVLPGLHVNGRLTLGENIADLGGTTIAYEALERALAKDPSKRKKIGGFTPEQRFFLSLSQIWRMNCREAEIRRLVTVDPHSPGQFRGVGPHVNVQQFYDAFGIKEGDPVWRPMELRAIIW